MIFHHKNIFMPYSFTNHVAKVGQLGVWLDNNLTFTIFCAKLRSINSYKFLAYKRKQNVIQIYCE